MSSFAGKVRLVIADDTAVSLRAIVELLADKFDIVATAGDGPSALRAIRQYEPAVAVLDVSMPGMNGIEVARQVAKSHPRVAIVVISIRSDSVWIQAAKDAGALAFIHKASLYRDLVPAVQAVARGKTWFPPAD